MRKQTNKYSRLSQYGPNSKCHALMFRGKTGKHLMVKNHSNSSVISPALSRKAQIPPRPCSPGKISFPLTYHTAPDLNPPSPQRDRPPVSPPPSENPTPITLPAPLPEPFMRFFDDLREPPALAVHLVSTCLASRVPRPWLLSCTWGSRLFGGDSGAHSVRDSRPSGVLTGWISSFVRARRLKLLYYLFNFMGTCVHWGAVSTGKYVTKVLCIKALDDSSKVPQMAWRI